MLTQLLANKKMQESRPRLEVITVEADHMEREKPHMTTELKILDTVLRLKLKKSTEKAVFSLTSRTNSTTWSKEIELLNDYLLNLTFLSFKYLTKSYNNKYSIDYLSNCLY